MIRYPMPTYVTFSAAKIAHAAAKHLIGRGTTEQYFRKADR
jgi:hypothetical protein